MSAQRGRPNLPPDVTRAQQELIRAYRNATRRLERQLSGAALTDFQRFRITEQLQQIRVIIAALNQQAQDAAQRMIGPSYRVGIKLSADALVRAGIEVNMGNVLATEAIAVVADQMAMDLIAANASLEIQARRFLRLTQQKLLTEQQINQGIARGIIEGETRKQVSDRLLKQLKGKMEEGARIVIKCKDGKLRSYDPAQYAELVARTRTREAVTQGTIRTGMDYEVYLFQVSVHSGACEMCIPFQGKVFAIVDGTGYPILKESPPFHPNCILPETPVFAPGKRAAFVAAYNGPVIDIILSNSARVSVTPNHMLLTPTGFAFAKDLCEGQEVLYSTAFENVVFGHPNNNNRPSFIADIVESLSKTSGMCSSSVPATSEDFHGDGRFVNSDINVIWANGLLRSNIESKSGEVPSENDFDGTDIALFGLTCCRTTAKMLKTLALAADGIMGGFRDGCAALWPHLRHGNFGGFASSTLLNFTPAENSINDALNCSEFTHQFSYTLSGTIARANLIRGQQQSRPLISLDAPPFQDAVNINGKLFLDFLKRNSSQIGVAHVVFKGIRQYSGHVYDLQTDSSLYLCNGIVSSNCGHVLTAFIPRDDEQNTALRQFSHTRGGVADYEEYQAAIA